MVPPLTALARAVAPVVLYVDSTVLLCELILTILDLPRLKHPSSVLVKGIGVGTAFVEWRWHEDGPGLDLHTYMSIGSNDMMTTKENEYKYIRNQVRLLCT